MTASPGAFATSAWWPCSRGTVLAGKHLGRGKAGLRPHWPPWRSNLGPREHAGQRPRRAEDRRGWRRVRRLVHGRPKDDRHSRRIGSGAPPTVATPRYKRRRWPNCVNWTPEAGGLGRAASLPARNSPCRKKWFMSRSAAVAFPVIHLKQSSLIPDVMGVLAEEKAVRRAVIFCSEYRAMQRLAKSIPRSEKRGWSKRPTSSGTGPMASWPRPRPRSARCWLPRRDRLRPVWLRRATRPGCRCGRGPSTTLGAWNNSSAWEWMGSSPTCREP